MGREEKRKCKIGKYFLQIKFTCFKEEFVFYLSFMVILVLFQFVFVTVDRSPCPSIIYLSIYLRAALMFFFFLVFWAC